MATPLHSSDTTARVQGSHVAHMPTTVVALFLVIGSLAGLAVGIYSYTLLPSLFLAAYTFGVIAYLLGRALPRILTRPYKGQRSGYVLLMVACSLATVYIIYKLIGDIDLAVFTGLVAGGLARALLLLRVFPTLAFEVEEPTIKQHEEGWGDPGPYDFKPWRWRRHKG